MESHLDRETTESFWLLRLAYNLAGYATLILPLAGIVWYVRLHKLFQNETSTPRRCYVRAIRLLVYGRLDYGERPSLELGGNLPAASESGRSSGLAVSERHKHQRSFTGSAIVLVVCFVGLQASYLTWGLLQEKIITQKYYEHYHSSSIVSTASRGESFRDSQFLVFVNRVLAFGVAALYLAATSAASHTRYHAHQQPPHTVPFYKYFYCSFSNVLSSWFQYEALKFVSFPTQVLAKASKIIPVMLMGKLVSRKTYPKYEYAVAIAISAGMSMFLFSRPGFTGNGGDRRRPEHATGVLNEIADTDFTSLSGIILLSSYMFIDSFTSNWQSALFTKYRMSSIQMMCGVNLFSTLLTLVSLLQQGALWASMHFAWRYPSFAADCILLSICSASGQLFVFYTISEFGPVTFVMMMTVRQAVAIVLSCIVYNHTLGFLGTVGVTTIFSAIFFRVWYGLQQKKKLMVCGGLAGKNNAMSVDSVSVSMVGRSPGEVMASALSATAAVVKNGRLLGITGTSGRNNNFKAVTAEQKKLLPFSTKKILTEEIV